MNNYPIKKYYQLGSYYEDSVKICFTWNGNMGNTIENAVIPMIKYFGFNYYNLKNQCTYNETGYPDYSYSIVFYK